MRAGLVGKNSLLLACLALVALAVAEVSPVNRQGLNAPGLSQQFEEEARSVTSLAWNGEYWLIGTSDGWLVRLDGPHFEAVERVENERVHSPILWSGRHWLGTSGVYYCPAFAYDGQNLTELTYGDFHHVLEATYAGDTCVLLNWFPYSENYSILTWNGGPISVLVEDALDLLPCKEEFRADSQRLTVELLTNGSSCLIYACCGEPPSQLVPSLSFSELLCQGLYLYDGTDLINLSWALPEDMLWGAPPSVSRWILGELSNGTHWLAPSAGSRRLFLFDGTEFEEVEADPGLLQFDRGRIEWNGEYWLICAQGRLMRLKGHRLELALDLSSLGLGSFVPWSADWNGEHWLISCGEPFTVEDPRSCLLKYDGEDVELVLPPEALSLPEAGSPFWAVYLGGVAWGDCRWLIEATEPGDWQERWGHLLSYDGEHFEDITQGLDEAIVLKGGAPGKPEEPLGGETPPPTSTPPPTQAPPPASKTPLVALITIILVLGLSFPLLAKLRRSSNSQAS